MKMYQIQSKWAALAVAIAFLIPLATSAEVSLVSTGSVWKYLDDGSDQGTAWRAPGFNDSSWLSGPAELGFGDGGEATTNTSGFITYYYRHSFNVADTASITNLRALLKRDDGAIVWINGNEAFRDNMPTGEVVSTTFAATTAADDGQLFFAHGVNPSLLLVGANTIAVEVHQSALTSSDISFDFSLVANPLPSIVINTPTNNQLIRATSVAIGGLATPGGASVNVVEAFAGATKVGQSTNSSFSIDWEGVAPGNYSLTAKITDSSGLLATSAPVNITVQAPPPSLLVPRHSLWKYHNLNQDLGVSYRAPSYDDSLWGGPVPGPVGDNNEAGTQLCTSVIGIGPTGARFPQVYYRSSFTAHSVNAYQGLILRLNRDDTAAVYLNGELLYNDGVPAAVLGTLAFSGGTAVSGADEVTYFEYTLPSTLLVEGVNVLAVENHQQAASSSDLQFDLELEGIIDDTPPVVVLTDPLPNTIVLDVNFINVIFSEPVVGINASDLLINGEAATSIVTNNPTDFTFYFPSPGTGAVHVAWAPNHGITDLSTLANPFAGGTWNYTIDPNATKPIVVISEFMADNVHGIKDDDGSHSDWIELANIGTLPVNLNGWYLTDDATNLTKWRLPSSFLDVNKYLLVWASGKDRSNPAAPLHTNFKLSKSPSYLALVDSTTNVVSEFNLYPAQLSDISYGRVPGEPNLVGYFNTPTPGALNSTSGSGFAPTPVFSVDTGIYTNASLTLTITAPAPGGTIRYTVDGSLPNLTNSTVYTVPITFSTNLTIKARVFPTDPSLLPGPFVSKNYLFLDDTTVGFNSNMPLFIISTEGRPIPANVPPGGNRAKGSLTVIDVANGNTSLRSTPDFHGFADFEIFGQTSSTFGIINGVQSKLPIRMEIHDESDNDLKVGLLGSPPDSDWKLRNPYDDKSLMNDFLAADLMTKMGHYALRPHLVEVFFDTGGGRLNYAADYAGVFTLLDTIKIANNRLDMDSITPYETNEPAITGGYIFKKDKDSAGDINFSTAGGGGFTAEGLKIHEPKPNQLRGGSLNGPLTPAGNTQLNWLIHYLNLMEGALYAPDWLTRTGTNHYSNYLDVDSFVDFHWIVEFSRQIDGYRLSDYFHKPRNGKVIAGPIWDWNLSFGNANYLDGGHTNRWYYEDLGDADHIWLRRLITGSTLATATNGDPEFTQKIADRWSVLRTNILNGPRVVAQIDEISLMLSNAAIKDFAHYHTLGTYLWPEPDGALGGGTTRNWDVDYQNPLVYAGTTNSIIFYLKKFVNGRFIWIDSQFIPPPVLSASDGQVANGSLLTIGAPPGAAVFFRTDGLDPRGVGGTTNGTLYTGPITVNGNVRVIARAIKPGGWKNTWSGPSAVTLYTTTPPLRITEIMYHPTDPPLGSTNSASDFEYIEVKNTGGTPLNVNRFTLRGGVDFDFPNVILAPGQSAVIVANVAAFQSRYGSSAIILGTFSGNLNNSGDHLVLRGSAHEPILDFSFADGWYPATDGFGFSLVTANENGPTANWGSASGWRASSTINGSPGANDPAPPLRPPVVVNEALAHAVLPLSDAIELYNPTGSPADISGWYLSDDFGTPQKYIIPSGTIIPAQGYLVIYETNSFNFPTNAPNSFGLGARGDSVWLFSGDGVNLTGHAHGYNFGASANGVTFGRYLLSTGEDHFVAQKSRTLGAANAGPLVGPVVITEISYHPLDIGFNGIPYNNTLDEYIELENIASTNVPLYDLGAVTNTWHLRNAVNFDFPTGTTLTPGQFVLVVGFDPNADPAVTSDFRARNSVRGGTALYGPWNGNLDNSQDGVELARPDVPDTNFTSAAEILVDKVNYSDGAPWPVGADGFGLTLQRIVATSYGNDPSNWVAVVPTPGAASAVSGTPPVITSQPAGRVIPTGTDVLLTVGATGTPQLRYQWQLNGLSIPDGTNATLSLPNFQAGQAGDYNVVVYNSAGSARGTPFTILTRTGLKFLVPPVNRFATNSQTTNFIAVVEGSGTIRYQWRFNGIISFPPNVSGADTDTLVITNCDNSDEGVYTCTISDDYDQITSPPVTFSIIAKPVYIQSPLSQSAVQGGSVTFSVVVTGTTPLTYRWRKGTTTFLGGILYTNQNVTYSTLTLTNLQASDAASYNVVVTNLLGFPLGGQVSASAVLTVLSDFDHDGLPDIWEAGRAGFSTNNAADGLRDDDHDGMSNAAEYFAGTDYLDPTSYLKLDITRGLFTTLTLNAVSNRTYTIQYSDTLSPAVWNKLSDVLAKSVTRTESITTPNATTNRFYRVVTPFQR